MSLLLCRPEPVRHPYYIEILGIHIYSSQELCYVIYNNPLLAMEDFLDTPLITFIREELDMASLARKLQEMSEQKNSRDVMLLLILTECDYYGEPEVNRFKQLLAAYRKMRPAEYRKAEADALFQKRQYGKAVLRYQRILDLPEDQAGDDEFRSRVYHNLGAAYAQMFCYEKAFKALDRSYLLHKDPKTLKRIYFLTIFEPDLMVRERYNSLFTPQAREQWDQELAFARQNALAAKDVMALRELFKKDPVKRMSGAGELIQQWKQDYRAMS